MMRSLLLAAAAAALLVCGEAGATLVRKNSGEKTGPAEGGVGVADGSERLRVQCWQDGRKIIDESELAVVSLSIANQLNALRLRRTDGSDGSLSVVAQGRTTCLLAPHE